MPPHDVAGYFPQLDADQRVPQWAKTMHRPGPFRLGQWQVYPREGELRSGADVRQLQPKVMGVLCRLAVEPGELVSRDELVRDVWDGRAMSDEPLNRCIAELRSALGDDRSEPQYIETLPRRGYRLVANVALDTRSIKRLALPCLFVLLASFTAVGLTWDTSTPARNELRLLVLPLQSFSSEQDHQLLADSLTDELINAFNRKLDLAVMSRTTTFSLRERNVETLQLQRQLGVDFFVEGSMRVVGDSVRMSVQLVDAETNEQLASLVDVQPLSVTREVLDTIASEVAGKMGRSLDHLDAEAPLAAVPVYRQFLEGQHLWQQDDGIAIRKSVVLLEAVVAAEPSFAPAHANLAAAYYTLRNVDKRLPEYDLAIERHISAALEHDGRQPLARALRAVLLEDDDPAGSLRLLQAVVRDAPNLLRARRWYAQMLYRAGYTHEALQHMNYLYVRDPLSPTTVGWLADIVLASGDPEASWRLIKLTDAMNWRSSDTLMFYMALRQRDRLKAAIHLKNLWSHSTRVTAAELQLIVDAIFDVQLRAEAVALVQEMIGRDRPITRFWAFTWLDLLGAHDAAIDLMLAESHPRDIRVMYSVWHLEHRDLRRHPRFMQLIERFRLHETWATHGENAYCERTAIAYECE